VKHAWNSAKDIKKTYLLRKLTDHHRLLHELIVKNSGILSGDLWRLYLKTCSARRIHPIAVRTYSDYCNSLVELNLVEAKRAAIQGKVRVFAPVQ
jgi:Cdc6-like AAA superfamily ATPase